MQRGQKAEAQKITQQIQNEKLMLKSKRRSKRAQVKQSFTCQCGKIYLSFSALYLHVKNKHNCKLTTKTDDQIYQVQRIEGFSRYFYSVTSLDQKEKVPQILSISQIEQIHDSKPNNLAQESHKDEQTQIKIPFLREYLNALEIPQEKKIISNFIRFGCKPNEVSQKFLKQSVGDLPNYLNQFLLSYVPTTLKISVESQKWKNLCRALQLFCNWMFAKKITELQVINDVRQ